MFKISVMYPNTPGARFDHAYYRDKHMPLVKARLGAACESYTVDKGLTDAAQWPDAASVAASAAQWVLPDAPRGDDFTGLTHHQAPTTSTANPL